MSDKTDPLLQVIKTESFSKLVMGAVFLVFTLGGMCWEFRAQASTIVQHEARITAIELTMPRVEQKLDDIVDAVHARHRDQDGN